jgi:hypothetical protein
MTKSPKGRGIAPLFFDPTRDIRSSMNASAGKCAPHLEKADRTVQQKRRTRKNATMVDGIVAGERVVLAKPPVPESERNVEIQVRVALAAAGVMVMKHSVEPCRECGSRPGSRQGLGIGCSDLICIVPPHGRFLGIEMKRPGYSPSMVKEHQRRWLAVVRRFGGVTGVASSVEEAMALVKEARGLPCT